MNNIDYKKIKAWPFQEAIKLKNKVSNNYDISEEELLEFEKWCILQ